MVVVVGKKTISQFFSSLKSKFLKHRPFQKRCRREIKEREANEKKDQNDVTENCHPQKH
jgi:hypothetical protein